METVNYGRNKFYDTGPRSFSWLISPAGGSQLGSYCLARWVTTPSKSYYEFNMLSPYENFALLVSDLMLGLYSQKLLFWDVP
jgi:hypothetical protein